MSTPVFGSPAALAEVEKIRIERHFLAELHRDGVFDEVPQKNLEMAENTTLSLRKNLKLREKEQRFFDPSHGEGVVGWWEGWCFTTHPSYWYVKALIAEKKLKEMGVPVRELPDEMYYPTHDWLLFKGEYGPSWARGLPEGMDYDFDEVANE